MLRIRRKNPWQMCVDKIRGETGRIKNPPNVRGSFSLHLPCEEHLWARVQIQYFTRRERIEEVLAILSCEVQVITSRDYTHTRESFKVILTSSYTNKTPHNPPTVQIYMNLIAFEQIEQLRATSEDQFRKLRDSLHLLIMQCSFLFIQVPSYCKSNFGSLVPKAPRFFTLAYKAVFVSLHIGPQLRATLDVQFQKLRDSLHLLIRQCSFLFIYSRGQNYRAGRVKKMFYKNHHNFFPSNYFAKF